jgi:hypothetical protein
MFSCMQTWISNTHTVPHRLKGSVQTASSGMGGDCKKQMYVNNTALVTGPPDLDRNPQY